MNRAMDDPLIIAEPEIEPGPLIWLAGWLAIGVLLWGGLFILMLAIVR